MLVGRIGVRGGVVNGNAKMVRERAEGPAEGKLEHWRGVWRHFGLEGPPMLGFAFLAIVLATS